MKHDKTISVATASSRRSTAWKNEKLRWSQFCERLRTPVRGTETLAEYKRLPASEQDKLKDVGGFTGTLSGTRRLATHITGRDLVTLDLDNLPSGSTHEVLAAIKGLNCSACVYSTRKHSPDTPRLRVIMLLKRTVTPDEYEPIARYVADLIGMEMCDPTTFQASRLMYYPSVCRDSEYIFEVYDGGLIDADAVLEQYADWRDVSSWPVCAGESKHRSRDITKAADPTEKPGIVGAFCRVYDIHRVIGELLQGVYVPTAADRYTYAAGSTTSGAVVYEGGKFLYSNHATDPASGQLCNAFDLVRIHLYGHLDEDAAPGTPTQKLPSYKEMLAFASKRPEVSTLLIEERQDTLAKDFSDSVGTDMIDATDDTTPSAPVKSGWIDELERTSSGGIAKTANNILTILINDPALRDRVYFDTFTERVTVCGSLPWKEKGEEDLRIWTDADDSGLRWYIEHTYGIHSKEKVSDALNVIVDSNRRDSLRDYLDSLTWDGTERLDTLLCDYLGAPDTPYVREATRKQFCAAAARGFVPGIKHDVMLIINGPQGIGKSTLLSIMGGKYFNDSLTTFDGKDAYENLLGYWILEIGELASMSRSEVNTVKTFLSKTEDVYRMSYAKRTTPHPRRCVLFGTTNDDEYLRDSTGARRFWPVDVGLIPPTKSVFRDLPGERDQIWAEAVHRFRNGESLLLSDDTASDAVKAQETHRERSVMEGPVREFAEKTVPEDWGGWDLRKRLMWWSSEYDKASVKEVARKRLCAAEIWVEVLGGELKHMKRQETIEINKILSRLEGWHKMSSPYRAGPYGLQRGFERDDV